MNERFPQDSKDDEHSRIAMELADVKMDESSDKSQYRKEYEVDHFASVNVDVHNIDKLGRLKICAVGFLFKVCVS